MVWCLVKYRDNFTLLRFPVKTSPSSGVHYSDDIVKTARRILLILMLFSKPVYITVFLCPGTGTFCLHHCVQTLWDTLSLLSNGYLGLFPWGKAAEEWLPTYLHLVPEIKNAWGYISTPQYAIMAWCLVKAQGQI
jgi:hypothetical protein